MQYNNYVNRACYNKYLSSIKIDYDKKFITKMSLTLT